MARFYGIIGYGESVETAPGVWQDIIVEYPYFGDIERNARTLLEADKINDDLTLGNTVRVVADAYATEHFHAIKYVQWSGARWTVTDVEVQSPRLLLRLGGVYNGPTP